MRLKPHRVPILFGISLFVFMVSAPAVSACSCMPERPPCEGFGEAKAVFIGKVTGAKEQREHRDEHGKVFKYDVGEIYFNVEESFFGMPATRAVIHSGTGGGDCGYWFRRGERYLVYAYGESLNSLGTNICTRTRPLADAGEDLAFLRNLPRKGMGVRIFGSVVALLKDPKSSDWRTSKPLEGVTVQIEGTRRTFEAVTNPDGKYEITGLPAGKYKIEALVPDHYRRNEYWVRNVKINDLGCAEASFAAQNDSRITGTVFKPDGKPFPRANVELIPVDVEFVRRMHGDETWANEKGLYELEEIPPGRYLLGINISSSPSNDQPYPPTFYPGVEERARATVIEIGLGQKLTDLDIHLPGEVAKHTVRGFVLWPDGSVATGVDIHLEDISYPGWCVNGCSVKTDNTGRFELSGFFGYNYRVVSTADKPSRDGKPQPVYGTSDSFLLNGDLENAKVVLTNSGRPGDKDKKRDGP